MFVKSFTFFWFCSTLFSFLISSSAEDTLLANQIILDGETIVSLAGNFELGFFSLGSTTKNRYLCIQYKKMANGTVVWVANRETPLTNTPGVLKLSSKGILVLLNGTDSIIWSSSSSISLKNQYFPTRHEVRKGLSNWHRADDKAFNANHTFNFYKNCTKGI